MTDYQTTIEKNYVDNSSRVSNINKNNIVLQISSRTIFIIGKHFKKHYAMKQNTRDK